MMERVRMGMGDDDDLYSGYNDYPSAFSTKDLEHDEVFQQAIRTSYGRRLVTSKPGPGTAMRLGTASGYREGTGVSYRPKSGSEMMRPVTAVRGAGYTSQRQAFDPMNLASRGAPTPQSDIKKEETPEDKIKKLERRITALIEESCLANSRGEQRAALEKAKEASAKERTLIRTQEQSGLSESHNLDLTFSVMFNLASQYEANEMYTEALNTYQVIIKNRMFNNANRLKLNMGNIFYKLGQYPKAVKLYRMALDQVPNTHKNLRLKIMHNIGISFVKMAQFTEACVSFEFIMQEKPDFSTGFHLLLCYYALDDKDKMRRGFQMLLDVPPVGDDDDKYGSLADDIGNTQVLEVIEVDSLRKMEQQAKNDAEKYILTAAKLISPVIEDTFSAGYSWCVDTIKASNYALLSSDLEINKAVMYLKQKEFSQAINTLKVFEKKETKIASTAASNLAFIYFLQGDLEQAEKYGDMARKSDAYNSAAYVNLGNCHIVKGDVEKAKELYMFALDNDAACVEALYNLGLANKLLQLYDDAVDCFMKLETIVRHHAQVLYQLANVYELIGDTDQASEWYLQLLGVVPTDPSILQKIGQMQESQNEKQLAYQYHYDSYRFFPSNLDVLDWLGSYFIELQVPEKAIEYFEKAALMQPDEVKWQLLAASCLRRSGNYHLALQTYKDVHRKFPENVECLRFLVRMCSDLGLKEAAEYTVELKKAEKAKEVRERISSSRPGSLRSGSGRSSRTSQLSGHASPTSGAARGSPRSQSGTPSRLNKLSEFDGNTSYSPTPKDVDASYVDPLGPQTERPRTAVARRVTVFPEEDFGDDDVGEDLLPE